MNRIIKELAEQAGLDIREENMAYLSANNKDGIKQLEFVDFDIGLCIHPRTFFQQYDELADGVTIYACFGPQFTTLYDIIVTENLIRNDI